MAWLERNLCADPALSFEANSRLGCCAIGRCTHGTCGRECAILARAEGDVHFDIFIELAKDRDHLVEREAAKRAFRIKRSGCVSIQVAIENGT
jgi:hypothetical protein